MSLVKKDEVNIRRTNYGLFTNIFTQEEIKQYCISIRKVKYVYYSLRL